MLFTSKQLAQGGFQGAAGSALLSLVQKTVIAACDAADGVTDGIIRDPRTCSWDPHVMVCNTGQDPSTCLTTAQAEAVSASIAPLPDPVTRQTLFVGQPGTAQIDWNAFILNPAYSTSVYQMGLNNPAWDGSTFNLHNDLPQIEATLSANNATNPDLSAFKAASGKLIQYQSWEDGVALPAAALQYYDQVRDTTNSGDRSVPIPARRCTRARGIPTLRATLPANRASPPAN